MIVRNGLASVRRTPLKSILFFLLLFALTTAMCLGRTLESVCLSLCRQCDELYDTTAVIEYQGSNYPSRFYYDQVAVGVHDSMDRQTLEAQPYVRSCDMNDMVIAAIPGFENRPKLMAAPNVFIGTVMMLKDENTAAIREVLYSEDLSLGGVVHLFMEGYDIVPMEPNRKYLICGETDGSVAGVVPVTVRPLFNRTADRLGKTTDLCWLDVTDTEITPENPALQPFYEMAEAYEFLNRSQYAQVCADPSVLAAFSQQDYTITEGRLYTAEEAAHDLCCMLPEYIAKKLGLSVGDRLPVQLLSAADRQSDAWWPGSEVPAEERYLISGLFKTSAEDTPLMCFSGASVAPGFTGYTLGTLHLKNGTSPEELAELRALLPAGTVITVYDEGFGETAKALNELLLNARIFAWLTAAVTLAALVLFAALFIGRQEETLRTMFMLGTPPRKLRLYTGVTAAAVLLPAVCAAYFLSGQLSGYINTLVTKTLEAADISVVLYSNESIGVLKNLSAEPAIPVLPALLCCAAVFIAAVLLCLITEKIAVDGIFRRKKAKKAKKTRVKPERRASMLRGSARKYLFLSVTRRGGRSAAVCALSFVMVLLSLFLDFTLNAYRQREAQLRTETVISGYFTDYSGKSRSGILLPLNVVSAMEESELFTGFAYSCTDPYTVERVTARGTSENTVDETPFAVVPEGGFAFESFRENHLLGPKLVFTDSMLATAEFAGGSAPEITWISGKDDSFFSMEYEPFTDIQEKSFRMSRIYTFDEDRRMLELVAPECFLEKYGVSLGDTVCLLLGENIVPEEYRIIGSFKSGTESFSLYTRTDNSTRPVAVSKTRTALIFRDSRSCGIFSLTDPERLAEAKAFLDETGYSTVHGTNRYRVYPIIEDAEYRSNLEKLNRNIDYLEKLVPVLTAVFGAAGFAAAMLLAGKRKGEAACLRALGSRAAAVFSMFFAEQLLLCAAGTAAAAAAGVLLRWNHIPLMLVFPCCYLLGTLPAFLRLTGGNLMGALKEKE